MPDSGAAITVLTDVVVGGVRLDVDEVCPDEMPDDIEAVDNSDPMVRAGPVPPVTAVTLRCVGFGTLYGFDTIISGIQTVTLGVGRDGCGIVDSAISNSGSFILSIVECISCVVGEVSCVVGCVVGEVSKAVSLCRARHSE